MISDRLWDLLENNSQGSLLGILLDFDVTSYLTSKPMLEATNIDACALDRGRLVLDPMPELSSWGHVSLLDIAEQGSFQGAVTFFGYNSRISEILT